MGIEGIGARVARKEDRRFITGAGRYVDDMVVPGMKHAAFVRSPHAHADITSVDVSAAKDMPGVIGVLTGREIKADGIGDTIGTAVGHRLLILCGHRRNPAARKGC